MSVKVKPNPCFLDHCEPLGFVFGAKRWRSFDGKRLYTWDSLHGEIEVFTSRGIHIAVIDAVTGAKTKDAVPGRRIDV